MVTAALAGLATGVLGMVASRWPLLAWIALSPLGYALTSSGPRAAVAGMIAGVLVHGHAQRGQPMPLRPLGAVVGGIGWGVASGFGGAIFEHVPSWALVVLLPAIESLATFVMRVAGAPRWVHSPLACSQESWPTVIRVGWVGGERTVSGLLGAVSAAGALLIMGPATARFVAAGTLVLTLVMLTNAHLSLRRVQAEIDRAARVRIAAVVVNGVPPEEAELDGLWPMRSAEYRDVERAVARYEPHVRDAAARGARIVLLPEVAVVVDEATRTTWFAATRRWASELGITVIAPHFDVSIPCNTLEIIEPSGRVFPHDKQHPAPGLEPLPRVTEPPGPRQLAGGVEVVTPICVDLDYPDVIPPARQARGVVAVPANDWPTARFHEVHDRTAVWTAVLGESPVVRAAGHGLCSVRDGAGRLLSRQSSLGGPAVLVVDVPVLGRPVHR